MKEKKVLIKTKSKNKKTERKIKSICNTSRMRKVKKSDFFY